MRLNGFRPATHNSNRHTQRGLKALEQSIREDGYVAPITVAADGEALDGSARMEVVADIMDVEPLVVEHDGTRPVIMRRTDIASADTDIARRIALRANRVAQIDLDWNPEVLLTMPDALIESLWNPEELSALGDAWAKEHPKDAPEAQIDKAAELQAKWGTATGQLWQIGEHRLICGDCRESETWERLLDGSKANGVFTSPPYAEQRKEQYGGTPVAEYVAWWEAVQANAKANLAGDGSFFVNIKPHCEDGERVLYVFDLVLAMKRKWGWRLVDEFSWLHEDLPGAWPGRFRNGFEPVYQFSQGAAITFRPMAVAKPSASVRNGRGGLQKSDGGNWTLDAPLIHGMAQPSNVIHAGGNTDSVSHAAAFPVSLVEFFVKAYSDTGNSWLDPFCGSGTTLVACERLGRVGRGIEISEGYCGVTLERLSQMGLSPVKVSDG